MTGPSEYLFTNRITTPSHELSNWFDTIAVEIAHGNSGIHAIPFTSQQISSIKDRWSQGCTLVVYDSKHANYIEIKSNSGRVIYNGQRTNTHINWNQG